MSDGLFSTVDLDVGAARPGWRLHRLEVLNWGTFHKRVWTLRLDGANTLLTGDIGSGKSTLVDAVTTLLLPHQRISYNKAAGSEGKERTLRSYVLGHHKSERIEESGSSRPVGLRDHTSYSVVLGVFCNVGSSGQVEAVTLAQVFTQRDRTGQPERFYVTADHELSIERDFAGFGSNLNDLRRRLRTDGAVLEKDFPAYGRHVRRLLGIRSEQALDLFHQTVSMKSVGNLNDFVRTHMLEPADASEQVATIVAHFDDLTRAHEAVRRARDQLAALDPLLVNCDKHAALASERREAQHHRDAVGLYFTELRITLLTAELARLQAELDARATELTAVTDELDSLRDDQARLIGERAEAGGDRVGQLDRDIKELEATLAERRARFARYSGLLEQAALPAVTDKGAFSERRREAEAALAAMEPQRRSLDDEFATAMTARSRLLEQLEALDAEISSLSRRPTNLPGRSIELRQRMLADLGVSVDDVPYAGELIDVPDTHLAWRGAAERVLRGLGLSLLVPHRHYAAVAGWVNEHHLGARLVYLRVPERSVAVRAEPTTGGRLRLADVLVVEPGPFAGFLGAELARRADHVCVASVAELQTEHRAVTVEGQVRSGERHEKDDRTRVDDPRQWILGRSNARKVEALIVVRDHLDDELAAVEATVASVSERREAILNTTHALGRLGDFTSWSEVDESTPRSQLDHAGAERERLLAGSSRLVEIDRALARTASRITDAEARRSGLEGVVGGLTSNLDRAAASRSSAESDLAATPSELVDLAREQYDDLATRLADPVTTAEACDRAAIALSETLHRAMERLQQQMNGVATAATAQMSAIKATWPAVTTEMDASIEAAAEYFAFRDRVRRDDLPRFEKEFKEQLNTNAIRELARFDHWLRRQSEEIRDRVARINESLGAIDYSPGRYIKLLVEQTVNQDVRAFRADLAAVTGGTIGADDRYSEERFLEVKRIIERLRGRDGHTEADRAWARRVTDVRHWHTFSAAEIDKATETEWEHYRDSDGKSGGQKEKLAYTILAASLAYQFGLEWGTTASRDFRFAVIDEAFGRGSDVSTRYALSLFERLGLQLLIVTPLQKVRVIEPYVQAIGFVDNRDGVDSRVQTLTIEEYRERRGHGTGGR
jgi:uncharacterized protein YPO0396